MSPLGSNKPSLRGLTEDDLDDVMAIERETFAQPWTKRLFQDTLYSPISEGWGFEGEGKILGYVVFYTVENEAHIMNLAIHPLFRRRGLGLTMLQEVLRRLQGRDVTLFFLEVREGNAGAIGLYEKCGFERIGKRRNYYKETNEDALVMCLTIGRKENTTWMT